jgi:hypothetical protein
LIKLISGATLIGGLVVVAISAPWPVTLAMAAGAVWLWSTC